MAAFGSVPPLKAAKFAPPAPKMPKAKMFGTAPAPVPVAPKAVPMGKPSMKHAPGKHTSMKTDRGSFKHRDHRP